MTRLERRLAVALLVATLAPLAAVFFLGRSALGDAYSLGVNADIDEQLGLAVEAHRARIVAERESALRLIEAESGRWDLRRALEADERAHLQELADEVLERNPRVGSFILRREGLVIADAHDDARLDPEVYRALRRTREIEGLHPGVEVEIAVTSPLSLFEAMHRAGDVAEVYSRLHSQKQYVSSVYVYVLMGYTALVVALSLILAIVLGRRITRRVKALADASARVGAGDLEAHVPADQLDEIGELTSAFNEMVRDLRESRERIDYLRRISAWQEFARRLAHEIKNPLTPILLAVQETQQAYSGDDERFARTLHDARDIVEEEVATLRRLVGEFSSFARLPTADLVDSDLRDVLHDLERGVPAMLQDVYGDAEPRAEVSVEMGDSAVLCAVDTMMLKRCLDNLVRNALESIAGEAREGEGAVKVTLSTESGWATITLDDDGEGVPEGSREHIFAPYFTTKSTGTGLGLAIVKKVILEHGGEIALDESPRGGARFTIELPLAAELAESGGRHERNERNERNDRADVAESEGRGKMGSS